MSCDVCYDCSFHTFHPLTYCYYCGKRMDTRNDIGDEEAQKLDVSFRKKFGYDRGCIRFEYFFDGEKIVADNPYAWLLDKLGMRDESYYGRYKIESPDEGFKYHVWDSKLKVMSKEFIFRRPKGSSVLIQKH